MGQKKISQYWKFSIASIVGLNHKDNSFKGYISNIA